MAIQEVYVGSVGPFLYDDADVYDGTAEPHRGMWTPGGRIRGSTLISDNVPTNPTEVVRLADLTGLGVLNPTITDRTGVRNIGSVYQNTSTYWMIVAVTVDVED
jgi:hypothetical protein